MPDSLYNLSVKLAGLLTSGLRIAIPVLAESLTSTGTRTRLPGVTPITPAVATNIPLSERRSNVATPDISEEEETNEAHPETTVGVLSEVAKRVDPKAGIEIVNCES